MQISQKIEHYQANQDQIRNQRPRLRRKKYFSSKRGGGGCKVEPFKLPRSQSLTLPILTIILGIGIYARKRASSNSS